MKKSLLLMAIALVLVLAFAACGGNDTGTDVVDTPPPVDTPTPQPDPAPPVDTPDNGGEDVATAPDISDFDAFLDWYFPATDLGGITLRWAGFGNPYDDNPVYAARNQASRERVESRFNVTLEFLENDSIEVATGATWGTVPDAIIASIAAGDPVTHLFWGNGAYWFPTLANGGYLRNMDSFVRNNFPLAYWEFVGQAADGTVYGFMDMPPYAWNIFVYNRDLIRSVGMDMTPSEMFVAGRWSLDDFYNYLVELNALLPDDVTAFGPHPTWFKRMATFANGGYIVNPHTHVPGLLLEETLEPLRLFQRLVQDGLFLQPGFMTHDEGSPFPGGHFTWGAAFIGGSHDELFRSGRVAIANSAPWGFEGSGENFEFGVVPPPWGSNVTFPASGDWRDLKSQTAYNSVFNDANAAMILQGTPDVVTPEVFANMVMTWRGPDAAGLLVEQRELLAQGFQGEIIRSLNSSQHLFTALDVEIWEWYANNSTWENMDGVGLPLAYSDIWLNSLGSGADFRAGFESIMPEIVWTMYDNGTLLRENIPAAMWAQAEEFGANVDND